jgi:hypothetical protein
MECDFMQYGYYPNSYFQQYQPQSMQAQTSQPPVSTMGGFIPVQNENEARMYPIAPGTSATFIDENSPYCYTKTLGASQLDRPTFKKFRLVEETDVPQDAPQGTQSGVSNGGIDLSAYPTQADMDPLSARMSVIERMVSKYEQSSDARKANCTAATADKPTGSALTDQE